MANLVGRRLGIALIHRLAQLPAQPAVVRTPLAPQTAPRRRLLTITRHGSSTTPALAAAHAALTAIAASYDDPTLDPTG